jgi:hypothetical protein
MSTRTITGTVLDSAGNAATGTVRFVLERGTWSATDHAIPDETTATLTAGAFSVTIYTPARYKVYLPTGYHFSVNIPAGDATTLPALRLANEDLPDLSNVLEDWLAALEINGLDYAAGQTPRWDGDSWEPAEYYTEAEIDARTLDDVADVNAAAPNDGDVLTWDATPGEWVAADAFTQTDADALYAATAHTHDDRYYTEAEVNALIAGYLTQAAGDARYGQLGAANTWALAQTMAEIVNVNDSDSKITLAASGIINIIGGSTGQTTLAITGSGVTSNSVFGAANGSAAAPTHSFTGDLDTGMYRSNVNTLNFTAGATSRLSIDTALIDAVLPYRATVTDAATNTVTVIETLRHNTSGSVAVDFGASAVWQLESTTTENQDAATERVYWSTATHASRTARFAIQTVYNAGSLTDTIAAGRTGAADSTGLWLYDETAGSLKQVTRGAADSGGAGFRLLRVAN